MTFADTSRINLAIKLDTIYKAEQLIREFTEAHNTDKSSFTDQIKTFLSKPDAKRQYIGLAQLYQKKIIPELEKKFYDKAHSEVKKKWQGERRKTHHKSPITGVMETERGFAPEVRSFEQELKTNDFEYWRRIQEQTRLSSVDNILKTRVVESDAPSGFDMGTGKEDWEKENKKKKKEKEKKNPKEDRDRKKEDDESKDSTLHTCPQCRKRQAWSGEWIKWGTTDPSVCSSDCLFNWVRDKKGTTAKRCDKCQKVKRAWETQSSSSWDKKEGKFYCSDYCYENRYKKGDDAPNIDKLREKCLSQLENLFGWDTILSREERKNFIQQVNNSSSQSELNNIIRKAQSLISSKKTDKGDEEGDDDHLQAEIQKAIQEIEAELNKEPKIKEAKNYEFKTNWKDYIKTASNIDELKIRKEEILKIIQTARTKQALNEAIQQIKSELAKEPPITSNELDNPNWETELNALSEKSKVEELRDKVLANIIQKRGNKQVINQLEQLISQAQVAANNKDWGKLKELLEKINSYQNNAIYESKQGIIKELEQKLASDNFPKYQEMTVNSVDEFLEKAGIKASELSPENQNYQTLIKQAKTPAEVEQIKDNAINDGGTKKVHKEVVNLLEEAKQADTDEKKSVVRQKINLLKKGNKWEKDVYEKYQSSFAEIMVAWANSADLQFGNGTPPNSKKTPSDKRLPIPLIAFLVVALAGVVIITGLLIVRNRQRKY